jgi:aspartate aminotransferase/aminotransferase
MEQAATLKDVIHLEVGEPDFATPAPIIDAVCAAARAGFTKYTPNAGIASLREAIAAKVRTTNGLAATLDNIVVTPGAVAALSSAMLAMVNPGDEVLMPDPGWPNYAAMILIAGGVPVRYPLRRAAGYLPDVADLHPLVTPRTKLIMTCSPGNPTGAVFSRDVVRQLVEFASQHDLYVLSDEVYEAFVFDGAHEPAAQFDTDGRVVTVFGFSKTYAMTGWRLGYAVANPAIATLMAKLQEPLVSCAAAPTQKGAEAALQMPQDVVIQMRDSYRVRRDAVMRILSPAGLLTQAPQGAFYALVDLSRVGSDSYAVARGLLDQQLVATAPGETFGPASAGLVRISLATEQGLLEQGCRRIVAFAEKEGR